MNRSKQDLNKPGGNPDEKPRCVEKLYGQGTRSQNVDVIVPSQVFCQPTNHRCCLNPFLPFNPLLPRFLHPSCPLNATSIAQHQRCLLLSPLSLCFHRSSFLSSTRFILSISLICKICFIRGLRLFVNKTIVLFFG